MDCQIGTFRYDFIVAARANQKAYQNGGGELSTEGNLRAWPAKTPWPLIQIGA
jgi:hypothetical protein